MSRSKDSLFKINDSVIITNYYGLRDETVTVVDFTTKLVSEVEQRASINSSCFYKIIENKPMYGFKFLVNNDDNDLSNNQYHGFKVVDPRGFRVYITTDEAQRIIRDATIINGNIMNEMVYVTNKDDYFLTVVGSSTYNKYKSNTARLNSTLTVNDLKPWSFFKDRKGSGYVYLGKYAYIGKIYPNKYNKDFKKEYKGEGKKISDHITAPKAKHFVAELDSNYQSIKNIVIKSSIQFISDIEHDYYGPNSDCPKKYIMDKIHKENMTVYDTGVNSNSNVIFVFDIPTDIKDCKISTNIETVELGDIINEQIHSSGVFYYPYDKLLYCIHNFMVTRNYNFHNVYTNSYDYNNFMNNKSFSKNVNYPNGKVFLMKELTKDPHTEVYVIRVDLEVDGKTHSVYF